MENVVRKLIRKGESHPKDHIEFKESHSAIPISIYETVCAFLNTQGGDILLGVKDNGDISGILHESVNQMKRSFVNTVNSPNQLNPPFCLSVNEVSIDNQIVLHIFVPEGSQVHRCKNKIYLRNNEGKV